VVMSNTSMLSRLPQCALQRLLSSIQFFHTVAAYIM